VAHQYVDVFQALPMYTHAVWRSSTHDVHAHVYVQPCPLIEGSYMGSYNGAHMGRVAGAGMCM